MDLSVIIPVFNTDINKLNRCFESVKKIDDVEYECLIIDDGSKNEIGIYCLNYANRNRRFKYFYKENAGVSSARNLGIEKAIGKTIFFVDSDDEFIPINIKRYIELDIDLIFTNIDVVNNNGNEKLWRAFDKNDTEVTNYDVLMRMSVTGIINGPCGKYIKKSLVDKYNIRFNEDMFNGEDAVFLLDIIRNKPKMFFYNESSYIYYREIETSERRMFKNIEKYIDNSIFMYKRMIDEINECTSIIIDKDKLYTNSTERYIKQVFNIAADLSINNRLIDIYKKLIKDAFLSIDTKNMREISLFSNIRYNLITKDKWLRLHLVALIRDLYLKLKH